MCYDANVLGHLWLAQASEEQLKKNQGQSLLSRPLHIRNAALAGSIMITGSLSGYKPGGSSMVRFASLLS